MTSKISYKMATFLRVLPTRWRRGKFAYKMAAFLRSLPTRWRRGNFAYKMAAFLRVLPTRWQRGRFAYKMAAFLTVDNAQSHVTAFRPISEAARSWSDDNENCAATVILNILSLPVK